MLHKFLTFKYFMLHTQRVIRYCPSEHELPLEHVLRYLNVQQWDHKYLHTLQ